MISIFLILLGIFLGCFVYPEAPNKGIDFLNQKFGLKIPHIVSRPFQLGLDLKGGVELLYSADLSKIEKENWSEAMDGLKEVIENRINIFGVREAEIVSIATKDGYRLSVKIPGIKDPEAAIKEIGKTPYLEFKEERTKEEREKIIKEHIKDVPEDLNVEMLCFDRNFILGFISQFKKDPCYKSTKLTGRFLKRAQLAFDQNTQEPIVTLEFNKEGSKIFEDLTQKNVGKILAIYIDNILISAPRVQEKISGGRARITGRFTVKEARDLANNLNAGALPVPIQLISQKTVGATLGMISLEKSLKAGIIGFLAVILFLIIFYKLPGLLASLALCIYVVIILFLFKMIPVTLTLAGIGGFILSVGMAVDANILIFARMKEERKQGKMFVEVVKDGFSRAWPSIRDSNLTTLLVALILFVIGSSFVKGFATTLSIGILTSMFSAIFVTRSFLLSFANTKLEKLKRIW
ncbi:MAG: protein translocase subunit SecD [Candidatus Pacebacteria bacterium]|nr:protein translocase subunit SecD [Candidatus Paceibacterota bacterium]